MTWKITIQWIIYSEPITTTKVMWTLHLNLKFHDSEFMSSLTYMLFYIHLFYQYDNSKSHLSYKKCKSIHSYKNAPIKEPHPLNWAIDYGWFRIVFRITCNKKNHTNKLKTHLDLLFVEFSFFLSETFYLPHNIINWTYPFSFFSYIMINMVNNTFSPSYGQIILSPKKKLRFKLFNIKILLL